MNRFNVVNPGSGCGVPSTSSPKATDSCVCLEGSILILATGWDIRRLVGHHSTPINTTIGCNGRSATPDRFASRSIKVEFEYFTS